jgi:hypothetical protein
VVDGLRDGTANHRSQFYKDITIPFYGFNRPGAVLIVKAGEDESYYGEETLNQSNHAATKHGSASNADRFGQGACNQGCRWREPR